MHNDSVDFVVKSIQKSPLVNLNGVFYQEFTNFFDDVWLEKIEKEYILYNFDKLQNQEHLPRKKLSYQSKLNKELNILFSNVKITNALEKIYNTELRFGNCDVWQDGTGYFFPPHIDDSRIKLALQIYVGTSKHPGTKFFSSSVKPIVEHGKWKDQYLQYEIKEIYYKKNHGYSLLNNEHSYHGVFPVTGDDRLSVYVRYT